MVGFANKFYVFFNRRGRREIAGEIFAGKGSSTISIELLLPYKRKQI
jgi:hypothetical protein